MRSEVVSTTSGLVQGVEEDSWVVFRGIPYAAPPFGDRLWQLPALPEPWTDVRDCSTFGPICPQPTMGGGLLGTEAEEQGEDCLRLNVWAPLADSGIKHPVMVWIHGGAYLYGSGSAPGNQGHTFARDGVVFVSINYRLGAIGFLHAGSLRQDCVAGSGNYGIADQVAALQWVHDNIDSFGGDPDNVTVLGVSAGGNYTQAVTACPQAAGLFKRAISQSAGGPTLAGLPLNVAGSVATLFFDCLGLGEPENLALQNLTTEQLLSAQAKLLGGIHRGEFNDQIGDLTIPFYPVSGTDYQPLSVSDAHASGLTAHIDMIIGTNRHEMSLFKIMAELGSAGATEGRPTARPEWQDRIRATYRQTEPDASDERIKWTVEGDQNFRIPNLRVTEDRVRNGGRTWWYEFAWESPVFDGRIGASHGMEIPFVFDDTNTQMGQFLLGGVSPDNLAKCMHETWITFARTGIPSSASLPEWPEFTIQERSVAVFSDEIRIETDRDAERRMAWEGVDIRHRFPTDD